MVQLNFNAATVAPQEAFDTIPPGWYDVQIVKSENKPTQDGAGSYLNLEMVILTGPFAKRKVFDRLNLNNKSAKAVEIAYQTLSAICHATGVIQLQESTQLHGIPMQAKVKVRPAEGKYSEGNEVAGYRKAEGLNPAQGMPAPTWVQPAQNAAPQSPAYQPQPLSQPASPPWAK